MLFSKTWDVSTGSSHGYTKEPLSALEKGITTCNQNNGGLEEDHLSWGERPLSTRGLEWGVSTPALLTFGVSSFSVGAILVSVGFGAVSLASIHSLPGTLPVMTATESEPLSSVPWRQNGPTGRSTDSEDLRSDSHVPLLSVGRAVT